MVWTVDLKRLEAESIHNLREAVAEAQNPVMMYSIGKDSGVMLHLARKFFNPAPPPFPLLHIDTDESSLAIKLSNRWRTSRFSFL
jgi:3'-phosphoadenosine 5'-phosphosulfate sulfotransferase (PAPS reductase)/FAD synthetase